MQTQARSRQKPVAFIDTFQPMVRLLQRLMSPCPIAPADRRLRDAFHHWRKMERAYFEPYEFRVSLNSFIQETRNVTFILQKNKNKVPAFESFYTPWQARLREDSIMRWAVESRNTITKQGDLETESQSFVTFTADWTDERTRRFRGSPVLPSTVLINQALEQIPQELVSEDSLLCVERRWVDVALPANELLSASSHVLIVLSTLLEAAHAHIQCVVPQSSCEVIESLLEMCENYPLELARAEESRSSTTFQARIPIRNVEERKVSPSRRRAARPGPPARYDEAGNVIETHEHAVASSGDFWFHR